MRVRRINRLIRTALASKNVTADVHRAVVVNTGPGARTGVSVHGRERIVQRSSDEGRQRVTEQDRPQLSDDELGEEQAEELPDREAMSLVDLNAAAPINAAAALNVLSDGSTAYANAEQTADIDQST